MCMYVLVMQCAVRGSEVQVRWKDNKGINLGLIDAAQVIGINPAGGNNGVEQIAIFIALVPRDISHCAVLLGALRAVRVTMSILQFAA